MPVNNSSLSTLIRKRLDSTSKAIRVSLLYDYTTPEVKDAFTAALSTVRSLNTLKVDFQPCGIMFTSEKDVVSAFKTFVLTPGTLTLIVQPDPQKARMLAAQAMRPWALSVTNSSVAFFGDTVDEQLSAAFPNRFHGDYVQFADFIRGLVAERFAKELKADTASVPVKTDAVQPVKSTPVSPAPSDETSTSQSSPSQRPYTPHPRHVRAMNRSKATQEKTSSKPTFDRSVWEERFKDIGAYLSQSKTPQERRKRILGIRAFREGKELTPDGEIYMFQFNNKAEYEKYVNSVKIQPADVINGASRLIGSDHYARDMEYFDNLKAYIIEYLTKEDETLRRLELKSAGLEEYDRYVREHVTKTPEKKRFFGLFPSRSRKSREADAEAAADLIHTDIDKRLYDKQLVIKMLGDINRKQRTMIYDVIAMIDRKNVGDTQFIRMDLNWRNMELERKNAELTQQLEAQKEENERLKGVLKKRPWETVGSLLRSSAIVEKERDGYEQAYKDIYQKYDALYRKHNSLIQEVLKVVPKNICGERAEYIPEYKQPRSIDKMNYRESALYPRVFIRRFYLYVLLLLFALVFGVYLYKFVPWDALWTGIASFCGSAWGAVSSFFGNLWTEVVSLFQKIRV